MAKEELTPEALGELDWLQRAFWWVVMTFMAWAAVALGIIAIREAMTHGVWWICLPATLRAYFFVSGIVSLVGAAVDAPG